MKEMLGDALIEKSEEKGDFRLQKRFKMLGIPEKDLTPEVTFALSALLEKLDDSTRELNRTRETLSELERLVDVDCLAPIPNRRAFMRRLQWAIAMHERYAHPSCVLYFDLNGFKAINDNYGHAAGDVAIRHVAQILANTMRESDFIARIGGDEFAIIMYHAEEDAARKRGEKIAEAIRRTPFMYNGKPITVSSSVGLYSLRKGDNPEVALTEADTAMYLDKHKQKAAQVV
jgi:diguanylate cyclase (GGDEF)-like protein